MDDNNNNQNQQNNLDLSTANPPPTTPPAPTQPPAPSTTPNENNKVIEDTPEEAVITTDPKRGKKLPGGKFIVTMLGVLLMVSAVGAGVYLSQNQQILKTGAWDCNRYTFSLSASGEVKVQNNSSRNEPLQRAEVYINNQIVDTFNIPALKAGESATIGQVSVPSENFSWRVTGTVDCSNSGNYEIATPTPTPTPTSTPSDSPTPTPSDSPTPTPTPADSPTPTPSDLTAACGAVTAYDLEWNPLSSTELSNLESGDTVRFAINGTSTSGSFDMARFSINSTTTGNVTDQKSGTGEFYYDYEIPDGVNSFNVTAEMHHDSLGWI